MSPPPQDPRATPLLQTVCHAGLLTLVALMADHAHQLPRPHTQARPLHHPDTKTYDSNEEGDAEDAEIDPAKAGLAKIESSETDSSKIHSASADSGKIPPAPVDSAMVESAETESPDVDKGKAGEQNAPLPALVPPIAPLYSFDEDGDILPLTTAHTNPPADAPHPTCSLSLNDNSNADRSQPDHTHGQDTHVNNSDVTDTHTETSKCVATKAESMAGEGEAVGVDADVDRETSTAPAPDRCVESEAVPAITVQGTGEGRVQVPKINFHAGSVEAEEDYLEEDHQLRDFCASLLGETGWGPSRAGGAGHGDGGAGLLTVTPQDPSGAARKSQQRVPFNSVVFSERKPSTGDALVLSLGLGADDARTIPDIASKNQGAARERLQQGHQGEQQGQTRQCESCGVSPEECLKRLGLHSDVSSPAPSPKSERVLHFFRQLQGEAVPRIGSHRCHATTDPEFDAAGRQQSRSLGSSPTLTEDDGRKSRLVAL